MLQAAIALHASSKIAIIFAKQFSGRRIIEEKHRETGGESTVEVQGDRELLP